MVGNCDLWSPAGLRVITQTAVNIPHLHLLLNHIPTVGAVVGLGLLLLAGVRRNDDLTRAALEVLFIVAVLTLPVYLTGTAAQQRIRDLSGVGAAAIRTHESAALLAFVWMEVTGFVAWLALWQTRRLSRPSRASISAVLLLSVVTVALMGRAATLGGEIRHPEILASLDVAPVGASTGWFTSATIAKFVADDRWVWPAAETLHFLGLCLAFGVLLAVNLRILGGLKALSFASVHRLLPWGMLGFGLNLLTGMLFFVAMSGQYVSNVSFYWKVVFLALAGAQFLYLTVFDRTWRLNPGEEAAAIDKLVAALGIGAWVGVIYFGRMLPYLGNAY